MEYVRMIWDFRGPHAEETASHHARHLQEFADREKLNQHGVGHQRDGQSHYTAYMIIDKQDMIPVRDALRPNRAQYEEDHA